MEKKNFIKAILVKLFLIMYIQFMTMKLINYLNFGRESNGSDVFILEPDVAYISEEWVKWYLIESVISNFFVAIRDGNLEVIINGTEVNQSNLTNIFSLLNEFYEKNSLEKSDTLIQTQQFLQTLDKAEPIAENLKGYGEILLWLYKDPDTKWKNVAIVRKMECSLEILRSEMLTKNSVVL